MALNRIQKLFVKLAGSQRSKRLSRRWTRNTRRKRLFGPWGVSPSPKFVKIQIISAITGEVTIAKANESSKFKLKKWLKMRNVRAQFMEMIIKKNSIWDKLYLENTFKDYPIIVKIGTLKMPYLIDHMGDPYKLGKKTVSTMFLRTIDNIDYLTVINERKEALPKPIVIGKKKKK